MEHLALWPPDAYEVPLINSCSSTWPPCLHRMPCNGTSSMQTWLALFMRLNQRGELPSPPAHAWVNESALVSLTYSRSCTHTHHRYYISKLLLNHQLWDFNHFSKKHVAQKILTWSKDGTQWWKCFISSPVLSRVCHLLISLETMNSRELLSLCQS